MNYLAADGEGTSLPIAIAGTPHSRNDQTGQSAYLFLLATNARDFEI